MDPYSLGYNSNSFDLPLNHKVFLAAFDTIKELAKKDLAYLLEDVQIMHWKILITV